MSSLQWLTNRFETKAADPFMIWRGQPYSYGTLLDAMAAWRRRLEKDQLASGTVVALEGDYAPDVIALLLVLIEFDAIIVPLTSAAQGHKAEFMAVVEAQVVISFAGSGAAEVRRLARQVTNPLTRTLIRQGAPGLVLFSSGSTGKNKAVLHNFLPLLTKFEVLRQPYVVLTFLLLDHIGGINTLLYALSTGSLVVSVASRDPDEVCAAIEQYRVELLPTSPTFLNLVLISEAYTRHDLSSLKRVTYGTEVMPARTLERIRQILPHVELSQTYGLSELGILRAKSRSSDSLWVKIGGEGYETKVQDGLLWIRARSSMLGYLNAPSPFDRDGWLNTGDAVEVDGEYIRILGRQCEVINVGGAKVYPAEVESVLLQMPNVRDVVVGSEPNAITGRVVVARVNLFVPEDIAQLRRRLREFCRDRLEPHKIPAKVAIATEDQYSDRFKKVRAVSHAHPSE
jgi:long-chain acyl-CoA synthetase